MAKTNIIPAIRKHRKGYQHFIVYTQLFHSCFLRHRYPFIPSRIFHTPHFPLLTSIPFGDCHMIVLVHCQHATAGTSVLVSVNGSRCRKYAKAPLSRPLGLLNYVSS